MEQAKKVIVEVLSRTDRDGRVYPIAVKWEDGRKFRIDRIMDVCRAASLKAGGQGMRYTCAIRGREAYLYYDAPIWFMEGRM